MVTTSISVNKPELIMFNASCADKQAPTRVLKKVTFEKCFVNQHKIQGHPAKVDTERHYFSPTSHLQKSVEVENS